MNATDRNTAVPEPPDESVDAAAVPADGADRGEPLADTLLDRATAARLRDESRRTRARIERRLAEAGHMTADGEPVADDRVVPRADHIDAWRDLSDLLDDNVAFFEHIDTLHDRRAQSRSPRERQVATRVLAEALHRIVSGYRVDDDPPHRPVMAARRADEWLGRTCRRLAARGPQRQRATRWWARNGRWIRLVLALVACVLLIDGRTAAAALAVGARAALSFAFYAPARPVGPRRQLIGYDPHWATAIGTNLGDAAIVAGFGIGLHLGGHSEWGVVAVLAACFRVIATMLRVASGHHGFRLPRLWLDRVAMTVGLPAALAVAAVVPSAGPGRLGGVPVAVAVVAIEVAIGLVEVMRVTYFAWYRRRLFRRAAAAGDALMPDAIVTHTSDAIVVNLTRAADRPGVLDAEPAGPRLRAVGDGHAGNAPPGPSAPPGRRGRRRRAGRG